MPKRTVRIREGEPLFALVSHGRGGPRETSGRFTPTTNRADPADRPAGPGGSRKGVASR